MAKACAGPRYRLRQLRPRPDPSFAGEMVMTWSFEPASARTRVTVTAENVPPGISKTDHDTGLRSPLENLRRYLG